MGRAPCCDKQGLKKGPWTPEEDKLLVEYIQSNGHGSWRSLPKLAGLLRCGKSCRLRWTNYLRPDIKRGPFTPEEEKSIIQLHGIVGNKWSIIAGQLPGRTDNEIKNYWNTHLKKRLLRMGINPDTFSSVIIAGGPATPGTNIGTSSSTRHMAQWESARLEAEARLSRESVLSTETATNVTMTDSSIDDHQPTQPVKSKAMDFFLRIWNSDIGEAFRKESSVTTDTVGTALAKEEEEEMVESKSCITASEVPHELSTGSDEVMDTSDEAYQMYLDFAAGDELCLLGGIGSFTSLFSVDMQEVAGL